MRHLVIPLIAAISIPTAVQANWLGKYGSRYEAWRACQRWQANKKSLSCKYDKETKQVLGLKNFFNVKKRFKY